MRRERGISEQRGAPRDARVGLFWPAGRNASNAIRVRTGRAIHMAAAGLGAATFAFGIVLAASWDLGSGSFILGSAACHAVAIMLAGRMARLALSRE